MFQPRTLLPSRTVIRGCVFFLLSCATGIVQTPLRAQECSFHINYISDSRIFTAPRDVDPVIRNATNELGSAISGSMSVRFTLDATTSLQLSVEYMPLERRFADNHGTRFTDGFRAGAVEACGLFTLPLSSLRFSMYVGGGGGLYAAERDLSTAGIASRSIAHSPAFGIVTLVGLQYRIVPSLVTTLEWRFRNPQITTENVYDQPSVRSGMIDYPLSTTPFLSRINLNGNVFRIGVGWIL